MTSIRKRYTFTVHFSFNLLRGFSRSDVHGDGDVDAPEEFEPTDTALVALEKELAGYLTGYLVNNLEANSELFDFIEIDDKLYVCRVLCSFDLGFTFEESGVEQDSGSAESDVCPTEVALTTLGIELAEAVSPYYPVYGFEATAGPEDLLSVAINGQVQMLPERPRQPRGRVR